MDNILEAIQREIRMAAHNARIHVAILDPATGADFEFRADQDGKIRFRDEEGTVTDTYQIQVVKL